MNYFSGKISSGYVSVFTGRMVLNVSGALLGLFIPIFLYQLFDFEIRYVFYYYIACHSLYATLVAWGCKYLNKIGLRRSLQISIIWGALYYFIFYLLDKKLSAGVTLSGEAKVIIFFVSLNVILITLNRLMYWVPMLTDIAKFTNRTNRGRQVGLMEAMITGLKAILPLLAGWILFQYNYGVLYLIAILIFILAIIPFMTIPKTREKFSWTYLETWKKFLARKRRKLILAYLGNGAENIVGIVIWPIFIWDLLRGNYLEVGALTSLIVVVTILLQLAMGKFTDQKDKKTLLKYGTVFYAIGWIIKIFIATAFQIFISSTYHSLTKIFTKTPFDTMFFEYSADQGHYVDEYTVLHEMADHYGKALMIGFALILTAFVSIQWTFVLAALASLSLNLLADEELRKV